MTMLQIMNSLTKTTMKMNNKNNNSAVNAGPKGTLSKEMKDFAKNMVLLGLNENDFEYLFEIKWEDRPKELDDEIKKFTKEYDNFCEIMQNVKVWEKIPMIKLLEEEDDIRKAMEKRLDLLNLDPITFKPTNDLALHKLYNLLEEIGITRAELAAYDQPDFDCFYNPFDAEDYIEIATELDFEEAQIEHIAECTPPIDVYVTIVEKER